MDLLDLDRRALAATAARLDGLTDADLTLPTPCAGWDVRALVGHVVANNHLYASAASGATVDWAQRDVRDWVGDDPSAVYARSADAVTAVFGAADLDAEVVMPFGCFPARQAIAVHFVDILVHGWDLAAARGLDAALDDDLASAALDIVAFYPPDVFGNDAYFAARRPVATDASPGDRLVATLGRRAPRSGVTRPS